MARFGHMLARHAAEKHEGGLDTNTTLTQALEWFERSGEDGANLSGSVIGLASFLMNGNVTASPVDRAKAFEMLSAVIDVAGTELAAVEAQYLQARFLLGRAPWSC